MPNSQDEIAPRSMDGIGTTALPAPTTFIIPASAGGSPYFVSTLGYSSTSSITVDEALPSGATVGVAYQAAAVKSGKPHLTHDVSVKFFFSYVKTNFSPIQKRDIKIRLAKLAKLIRESKELGQVALCDTAMAAFAIAARESEALAMGISHSIDRAYILKYLKQAKIDGNVFFTPLSEFPRVVPVSISKKILDCKSRNLFDEYHILYLDRTSQKETVKSNYQRIKEKDPIVFGLFAYQPAIMYHIASWEDEYCDLTFDKLLAALPTEQHHVHEVDQPFNEAFVEVVLGRVKAQHERLKNTHSKIFRDDMAKEEEEFEKLDLPRREGAQLHVDFVEKDKGAEPQSFFSRGRAWLADVAAKYFTVD